MYLKEMAIHTYVRSLVKTLMHTEVIYNVHEFYSYRQDHNYKGKEGAST